MQRLSCLFCDLSLGRCTFTLVVLLESTKKTWNLPIYGGFSLLLGWSVCSIGKATSVERNQSMILWWVQSSLVIPCCWFVSDIPATIAFLQSFQCLLWSALNQLLSYSRQPIDTPSVFPSDQSVDTDITVLKFLVQLLLYHFSLPSKRTVPSCVVQFFDDIIWSTLLFEHLI